MGKNGYFTTRGRAKNLEEKTATDQVVTKKMEQGNQTGLREQGRKVVPRKEEEADRTARAKSKKKRGVGDVFRRRLTIESKRGEGRQLVEH